MVAAATVDKLSSCLALQPFRFSTAIPLAVRCDPERFILPMTCREGEPVVGPLHGALHNVVQALNFHVATRQRDLLLICMRYAILL